MKILITNAVALNGGDAAILYGLVALLRQAFGADAEILVYDAQAEVAGRQYPGLRFRESAFATVVDCSWVPLGLGRSRVVRRLLRQPNQWRFAGGRYVRALLTPREQEFLDEYAQADLVVSTGGTYLVERYPLRPRIFDFELALASGTPLVLFTQSLGPFAQPENRESLRLVFEQARLVLVRDEVDRGHVIATGAASANVVVSSDAAFALAAPPAPPAPAAVTRRPRVLVSVREWPYLEGGVNHYLEAVATTVRELVERDGAEVVFLSTCQGIPEYRFDDARVAAEIVARLSEAVRAHVTVDEGFHAPDELLAKLGGFDLAIATRMHMAILALVAGVPVVPIAYEDKTVHLFQRLELGELVVGIESVDAEALLGRVRRLLGDPGLQELLRRNVARESERVRKSVTLLQEALHE